MNLKSISQGIITASLGGAIALAGFGHFFKGENQVTIKETTNDFVTPIQVSNSSKTGFPSFETAAEKTLNSVVHIKTTSLQNQRQMDPFQELFFGAPPTSRRKREVAGSGSGVIISENGYITTNNHVIHGATSIEVTLNDKRTYEAKLIGTDPTTDLALLKIEEENLPLITYGNSDQINVGEWVLAVGNPFNLNSTVTAGIVSAKARNINILKEDYAIESFIQTDAAVNPGNSGGALVNQNGELVGINTAIASNTGSYTGYSFAIPVNMVKKIMGDLLQFGTVQRALLGVQIMDINQELAKKEGIENLDGVYISDVLEDGAAAESDLKQGDIIRKIENQTIGSTAQLQEKIGQYQPGDKISAEVERNGAVILKKITLKNKLGTTEKVEKELLFLGAKLDPISSSDKKQLNIKNGVKVSSLENGKLLREGIKKNYIILKINNQPVHSAQEVIEILKTTKGGLLLEGIYPDGTKAYYGFGI